MEFLTVVLSLLGIIGLIFLTYFASRWLSKKFSITGARSIKVLERVNFAQDKSIVMVKVGEKLMLLGVTPQHIEKISDLDQTDITEYLADNTAVQSGAFLENLKKAALNHQFIKPFVPKDKQGEQEDDKQI